MAVAALLAYRYCDEPLLPGAAAVLDGAGEENIPADQNLFFAVLGMGADAGDDLNAEGQRILALYVKNQANVSDIETLVDIYATANVAKIKARGDIGSLNCLLWGEPKGHQCIVNARANRDNWQRVVSDNARMLSRYKRLREFPRYKDPTFLVNLLAIGWPGNTWEFRRLYFIDLALQVDGGAIDLALHEIKEDLAFWRHLLSLRDITLIDKMVFTRYVGSDLVFISELLRTQHLTVSQLDVVAAALTPISDAERSLAGVYDDELRFTARWKPYVRPGTSWLGQGGLREKLSELPFDLLHRKNASINSDYRLYQWLASLDRQPCAAAKQNLDHWKANTGLSFRELLETPDRYVYGGDRSMYADYPIRLCGLQGAQRIVGLQYLIRRRDISDAQIPAFLADAGAEFADPFTGKPMRWDAKARTLSFDAYDRVMNSLFPWPI